MQPSHCNVLCSIVASVKWHVIGAELDLFSELPGRGQLVEKLLWLRLSHQVGYCWFIHQRRCVLQNVVLKNPLYPGEHSRVDASTTCRSRSRGYCPRRQS